MFGITIAQSPRFSALRRPEAPQPVLSNGFQWGLGIVSGTFKHRRCFIMKAVLALVSLAVTILSLYVSRSPGYEWLQYVAGLGIIGTIVFGGIYMAGRVNKDGNIRIAD